MSLQMAGSHQGSCLVPVFSVQLLEEATDF